VLQSLRKHFEKAALAAKHFSSKYLHASIEDIEAL
jgi:hypothetical protein